MAWKHTKTGNVTVSRLRRRSYSSSMPMAIVRLLVFEHQTKHNQLHMVVAVNGFLINFPPTVFVNDFVSLGLVVGDIGDVV